MFVRIESIDEEHNEVTVLCQTCSMCGVSTYKTLDKDKVERWVAGEKIQNVWPEMSPDEREVLISGTHGDCWDKLWQD